MRRVLLGLPVDARPVVRSQVQQLADIAGWELRCPPAALLGHLRTPGDRDALAGWLLAHGAEADGFVLSLDMLVHGGLVPSRFSTDPLPALARRLELLDRLAERWPDKPVAAWIAVTRISNNDVADEEKAYWAEHGRRIWGWSYHAHRAAATGDAASLAQARALEAEIPASVRADYRATRERNHALVTMALERVGRGIARLCVPQDDTAEWGFNVHERQRVEAWVAARAAAEPALAAAVDMPPGSDEVLHTLAAELVARLEARRPLVLRLAWSNPDTGPALVPLYEDRTLAASLHARCARRGSPVVLASDPAAPADLLLAVHTQGRAQGDWAMRKPLPASTGIAEDFTTRWNSAREAGMPVALADLAYANGGDPALFEHLQAASLWPDAYAGWNTAGNSLGSLLATCVLAGPGPAALARPAAREALSLRLLEDLAYQADARQALRDAVDETRLGPAALREAGRRIAMPRINAWAARQRLAHRVADIGFPWGRSFEVELQLEPAP